MYPQEIVVTDKLRRFFLREYIMLSNFFLFCMMQFDGIFFFIDDFMSFEGFLAVMHQCQTRNLWDHNSCHSKLKKKRKYYILTLKFISKTKLFYQYTKIHHSLLNSAHLIVFKNLSWTLHHLMCLSCVTWAFKARFNNFHFCIILHVIPLPSIYAIQIYRPSHIMRLN